MPSNRRPARHPIRSRILLAVAMLALSAASHHAVAQGTVATVPPFIEFADADPATPVPPELVRAQNAFRTIRSQDRTRAIGIAKDIVSLAREAYGDPHDHVARALTNLAIVQAEDGDFGAAIQNYAAAIAMHERASNSIVSLDLINPLLGLGGAFMAVGDVAQAIPFFERAVHVSHVNLGVENAEQVDILDALSLAYFEGGATEVSSQLQDAILLLRQRQAADNPEQYLDALEQRSNWYVRAGEYDKAVWSFRRLRSAIAERYGDDDLRLIEPLVALANASVQPALQGGAIAREDAARRSGPNRMPAGYEEGKGALNHAVRIARANSDAHPERLARTLVHEGDWLATLNETRDADRSYREAWKILDADPERHRTRSLLFDAPKLLARAPIPPVHAPTADDRAARTAYPQSGYADVVFDVDKRGRPRNVEVVSANPPGLMDEQIKRQLRQFIFRPAYSDGKPRTFTGAVYRHTYGYDETRLTDRQRERIATTRYEGGG